jgi:hypothetical protein
MKAAQRPVAESKLRLMTLRSSARPICGCGGAMIGTGQLVKAAASDAADRSKTFPDEFLWCCATAGHQVESNHARTHFCLATVQARACPKELFLQMEVVSGPSIAFIGVYNRPVISPA